MENSTFDYEKHCKKAVKLGLDVCGAKLDYSKQSLEDLEIIIKKISEISKQIDEKTIWNISLSLGSYLGEVILKNGFKDNDFYWWIDDDNIPIISNKNHNIILSPIIKVYNKINNYDNVETLLSFYEQSLLKIKNELEKELTVDVKVTFDEYKKIKKYFPYQFRKIFLITSVIILAFFMLLLLPPDPFPIYEMIITDVVFIILTFIIFKIVDIIFRKYNYKKLFKKNKNDIKYRLIFHDDYIEKVTERINLKIYYSDIWKFKELDYTLYILLDKKNIIPISKENCSAKLITFIRNKLNNNSGNTNDNKEEMAEFLNDSKKSYGVVKILLIILFIATILMVWGSLYVVQLLLEINKVPISLFFSYMWGALLCLPIPILSIILGIIFKKKGLKSTKNIVAGIIVSLILLGEASFSFVFNFDTDYNEVHKYDDIIGVDLPNDGKFSKVAWDNSYLLEHTSNYAIFSNENEASEFYNSIKNNELWFLKDSINTGLGNLLPSSLMCESVKDECYYLIYNDDLEEYNLVPDETGKYHIYAMMYDPDIQTLTIEDFKYEYRK